MAIYKPEVVQEYLNEVLDTLLAVEAFCEVDDSLIQNPGDRVHIWRYSDTGSAEKLEYGEGNSGYSDIDGVDCEFVPKRCQDRIKLYDDDVQNNPNVANMKMQVAPKHLINSMRADVVGQWYTSGNAYAVSADTGVPSISELIMAQADLDLGVDNGINGAQERVCLFLHPVDYRKFQAALATGNTIVASEIIDGKVYSTVAGIPFAASEDVAKGYPVFATNKAVRLIHSKCTNTEVERDANTCLSTYYARDFYVAGLEFEKKALVFGKAKTITKTAPSHGSFTVPATAVPFEKVKIADITPAEGYKIGTISVVDSKSAAVTVNEDNTFVMPADTVTVAVTFTSAS